MRRRFSIFENQTEDDWAIVNFRDQLPPLRARKMTFSAYDNGADFTLENLGIQFRGEPVLDMNETKLRGAHNAENLMAALAVGYVRGFSFSEAMRATALQLSTACRIAVNPSARWTESSG